MKKLIITIIISFAMAISAYAEPFGVPSDNNDYLGFAPWAEGYRLDVAQFDIKNIGIAPYATLNNTTGISGVISIDMPNYQSLEFNTSILNLSNLNYHRGLGWGANYRVSLPGSEATVGISFITVNNSAIIKGELPQLDTMQINGKLEF